MSNYDDIFSTMFGQTYKTPAPKKPSEQAFELAAEWSRLSARLGALAERRAASSEQA